MVYFQTAGAISPHCIVPLPNSSGMQLLLCYDNEGVYVNTYGRVSKNIVLQVRITNNALVNKIMHTVRQCAAWTEFVHIRFCVCAQCSCVFIVYITIFCLLTLPDECTQIMTKQYGHIKWLRRMADWNLAIFVSQLSFAFIF